MTEGTDICQCQGCGKILYIIGDDYTEVTAHKIIHGLVINITGDIDDTGE